jgi:hypothetical protein
MPVYGGEDLPRVEEILERALDRDAKIRELNPNSAFTFFTSVESEDLDKKGNRKKLETRLYENVPYPGTSYARLIEIDGQPLSTEERREEQKRERDFLEKLEKGELPNQDDEGRVPFDEELVSKYDFDLQGIEEVNGRQAYVLSFRPKPGKLQARRRIDRALNKSKGTLWIDRDSYAISKLEFELIDRIRIWWGVIGSLSKMRGRLELQPVDESLWLPSRFEFYINGRIFFRTFHRARTIHWTGFERMSEEEASASSVQPQLSDSR